MARSFKSATRLNSIFTAKAQFLDFALKQQPELGSTARIEANVSRPELANLFWTYNHRVIVPSERISFDNQNTTVVIRNYTHADDGTYFITLFRRDLTMQARRINVEGANSTLPRLPSIACNASELPNRVLCKIDVGSISEREMPINYTVNIKRHENPKMTYSDAKVVILEGEEKCAQKRVVECVNFRQ